MAGLSPLAKRCLEFLIVVAAATVVVYALLHVRLVVIPVLIAIIASTVLVPPVRFLRRHGMGERLSSVVVFIAALFLGAMVVGTLVPAVTGNFEELGRSVRGGVQELGRLLASGPFGLSEQEVERSIDRGVERIGDNQGALTRGVVSGALFLAETFAGVILGLILLFFFVHDGEGIWRWALQQMPAGWREHADEVGSRAWTTMSGYLRGVATVATVDAVFIGVALLIAGVPLVVPLVALTFVAAFVPLVGAFAAGAVAVLVALVSQGIGAAVFILVSILVVQQLEGNLVYPVVVGRAIDLHPLGILLSVTAGSVLLGIVGALLAVPLASIAWKAWEYRRDYLADKWKTEHPLLPGTPLQSPRDGSPDARSGGLVSVHEP